MADRYFRTLPPGMTDTRFFRLLDALRIETLRRLRGGDSGERVVRRLGGAVEFSGHRSYDPGDDLRYLDWHLLARHDTPYTKTYHEQEYYYAHLLFDASASMTGMQDGLKWRLALDTATALAYLVLANDDRLRLTRFPGSGAALFTQAGSRYLIGPRQMPAVRRFLSAVSADGAADMRTGFARYAHEHRRRMHIVLIVSDFLTPLPELLGALNVFAHTACHLVLIRIIDEGERTWIPDRAQVRVRDAETGQERTLTLDEANRYRYEDAFDAHRSALQAFCLAHDIRLAELDTGRPWYDPYAADSLPAQLRHLAFLRPR